MLSRTLTSPLQPLPVNKLNDIITLMKRFFIFLNFCLFITIFIPSDVFAKIGVGVGTGKILVEEKLRSGEIYNLPPFTVLNTGDEGSNYAVITATRENQKEIKPSNDWFYFEPKEFYLNPGEAKTISVKLSIPLKTVPGDYFCFVEGYPIQGGKSGEATVGIAAAAKLYFTIAPSNFFQGIYYRAISLWKEYMPWTNIVGGAVVFYILISLIRKNVNIQIGIKPKEKENKNDQGNEK